MSRSNFKTRCVVWMIVSGLFVLSGCRVPPRTTVTNTPTPRPTPPLAAQVIAAQRTPTTQAPVVQASVVPPTSIPAPIRASNAPSRAQPANPTVDMIESIYIPDTITVTVGSTITWQNKGMQLHDVTAIDRTWDSGMINNGLSWQHTFREAGVYEYYCTVHPADMRGRVVVVRP